MSCRTTQAEYFDSERPLAELAEFHQCLDRVNRFFLFAEPFQRRLPRLLGATACRSLSVLDLGAGNGLLGKELQGWAARRGWDWRVTNLDLSQAALRLNPSGRNVAGSALALPFSTGSFDLVIASQMTHHLTDEQVQRHLREAWRVARSAIFLSDLHRNAALYWVLWLFLRLRRFPESFGADALLSVRRSWRSHELQRLATQAGIAQAQVEVYFSARVLLHARK
ncbi:MAG TPA: methyltransferase domain-containing protein [Bacillota bacterium]|nr:methyltransferase domain-containing protein [Bacillota bacterium]